MNYVKKRRLLKFIKHKLLLPVMINISKTYSFMASLKFQGIFYKRFLSWYYYINRNQKRKYNINNIILYGRRFKRFINLIKLLKSKVYIKLNKYKMLLKSSNYLNKRFKKRFKFFLYFKIQIKNYYKKMKILMYCQDLFTKRLKVFYRFYKKDINLNNRKLINYYTFSFKLKKKQLKKKKKGFIFKNLNLIFWINKMFNKFIFNLYLIWLNKLNINLDVNYEFNNFLFYNYKINFIIKLNSYKHFIYKKRFKKLALLEYLKNTKFLLFFNKI